MAAATSVVVTLTLTGAFPGVANADPEPHQGGASAGTGEMPSQAEVNRAKAAVANKKQSVAQLEGALAGATARLHAASVAAEAAAESYNGAMWQLSEARLAHTKAQAQEQQARLDVDRQRSGIVMLVTDSYQNGTELNTATAMMSDEGPKGMMNRYGVVASAGDSMQARYDAFRTASARAQVYAAKTARAEKHQSELAAEAKDLALVAGRAAAAAGAAANEIAVQKQLLVVALAKAENISVELATRRHDALERIAREKAAAAAAAEQAAEQAALQRAADTAKKKAAQAKPVRPKLDVDARDSNDHADLTLPVMAPPIVAGAAPNQTVAVQRAIAYAKQQVGLPYQWAASGPASFDCSGLTMQAWARGGKLLPHYSVAQFYQSTRVSMIDARPGDLLFWSNNGSPSGIHHVALYLGGGQFLEAPYTGANVRYNSIYNWYPDFVARP